MKLSAVKVDIASVEAGEWIGDLPEMEDLQVKVKGLDNEAYRRLRVKLIKAIPRGRKIGGNISLADGDAITSTLLLETVLLDWKGLDDDKGKPIPFSRELAKELLVEPDNRRFRDAVMYAASMVGESIAADEAEDVGNSKAP